MNPTMKPVFKYFWESETGEGLPLAFYGMPMVDARRSAATGSTVYVMSDVTAGTLLKNGFEIPKTPPLEEWRAAVRSKRKCGKCYRTLKGTVADWDHHMSAAHREFLAGVRP